MYLHYWIPSPLLFRRGTIQSITSRSSLIFPSGGSIQREGGSAMATAGTPPFLAAAMNFKLAQLRSWQRRGGDFRQRTLRIGSPSSRNHAVEMNSSPICFAHMRFLSEIRRNRRMRGRAGGRPPRTRGRPELHPSGRAGKRRRRGHAGVRELRPGLDLFAHNHSKGTGSLLLDNPSKHRATHQQER